MAQKFDGSETIAAVATPRAAGGIAVIRISGDNALLICDRIFKPLSSGYIPSEMDGYTCAYGKITDTAGEVIDDGVITVFKSPRSYTGENVAEISCHGGIYVTERILRTIFECGAVCAAPGEFTKRAYLNGKLTLTQAEAVMDIISAEGRAFYRKSLNVREGALYRRISEQKDRLLAMLGSVAAWIDYPEEDIEEIKTDNMLRTLEDIRSALMRIEASYDDTRILKAGIDTVIAGKPNVGKSTLMNMLAGFDKSIVTDIAGTTRDIVEESVRVGDIVLRLSDTAGLRETSDIIERIGIEKTKDRLLKCDLIIAVFDSSNPLDDDDMKLIELCGECKDTRCIACINKTDREALLDKDIIINSFENVAEISAVNNSGFDELRDILYTLFLSSESGNMDISVNERQKICLDRAILRLDEAIEAVRLGITLDAVNIVLDEALNSLLELTGERATQAVVDEVFSHFCVGK